MKVLNNLIFSIFILINLTSFSRSQDYVPSYLNSVSDIPIVSSNYFPLKIYPNPITNSTVVRFGEVKDLLATITEPILNASLIESLVNQWGTDFKNALTNSSVEAIPILNPLFHIAQLLPSSKYGIAADSWIAMKPRYDALFAQGTGIVDSVNAIVNTLNGTILTPSQQSQLNQYAQVIFKINNCRALVNNFAYNMGYLKSTATISKSYAIEVEDEWSTEADILPVIKNNNILMLSVVYDCYTCFTTLGNLNF